MRKQNVLRLVVVAVSVAGLATSSQAARRTGLAGNLLIEDKDDVYMFPQEAVKHARLIAFDYGGSTTEGNALLLLGDQYQAWGLAIHRADVIDSMRFGPRMALSDATSIESTSLDHDRTRLGAVGSPAGDGFRAPFTIIDGIWAMSTPGAASYGLRIALGNNSEITDPDNAPKEQGDKQTFMLLQGGMSSDSGSLKYDGAAALFLDFGTVLSDGDETVVATHVDISASFRGLMNLDGEKDTKLGILGHGGYTKQTIEHNEGSNDFAEDRGSLRVMGGAGPVITLTDRITVSAYGLLGLWMSNEEPNTEGDKDQTAATSLLMPGFNIATEIKLTDWWYFRTGTEYLYFVNAKDEARNVGAQESAFRANPYAWNAGFGFKLADLTFDGALQHGWLTSGPDFIGGDSPLFAVVSASARF